ncbi:MAG: hypothetical protein ACXWK3_27815, partial [Reyranella sp.]
AARSAVADRCVATVQTAERGAGRHAAGCVEFYIDLVGLVKRSGKVVLLKSDSQLQIKRGGKCS